jgi:Tol biopolymer transport system component
MSIGPGSRIGPYEVIGPLGEGGMGVVLRGRDTRLQRAVALKVLPDHLANDPDRMSRFQREAQILASLNHPHIAQVFGLEQAESSACIVMELVEGDTLAERLKSGPMPFDEVRGVATQLADALAAAHERGIVHRDLKPANIKVSAAGTVKVLDFGLAKAVGPTNQDAQVTTLGTAVTRSMPGTILGTPGYMSPEQARGKDVDARTDIWAFGCVLYEMLTGRQAFAGETATDVIAQIVTGQPDLSLLPANTPAPLRSLLSATLNKNPAQRLQHIGDSRLFLDPAFAPSAAAPVPVAPPPGGRGVVIAVAAAIALAAAALPLAWLYWRAPQPAATARRFELSFPGVVANAASLAPDGHAVAFIGSSPENKRMLLVRNIDSDAGQALAGTEDVGAFFWSADSRQLAFISDGKLRKVNATGAGAQVLADVSGQFRGAAWNGAGDILLARTSDNLIQRMPDSGGPMTPVGKLDAARKEQLHALPTFLPDGRRFLYAMVSANPEESGVFLTSLDGGTAPTRVVTVQPRGFNWMAYAPSGHLLIQNEGRILAYRMDAAGRIAEGAPAVLAEGIDGAFSVSSDNVLIYHKGSPSAGRQLTWYDRTGKASGTLGEAAEYGSVDLSPSGDRAAVDIVTARNRDVWIMDLGRAVLSRLTFEDSTDWTPAWSPDGSRVAYASSSGDSTRIYVKSASGAGTRAIVEGDDKNAIPVSFLPDGQRIMFARLKERTGSGYDTFLQPVSGGKPALVLDMPFDKLHVRLSPDGRYVAYASNESGPHQVFVQTFPDATGGRWQITSEGGVEPKWRRDGRELYYLALDGKLMAVPVTSGTTFTAGRPVTLFQTPLVVNRAGPTRDRRYDVSPDGRFLIVAPVATPAQTPFTVLVNWTAGLK